MTERELISSRIPARKTGRIKFEDDTVFNQVWGWHSFNYIFINLGGGCCDHPSSFPPSLPFCLLSNRPPFWLSLSLHPSVPSSHLHFLSLSIHSSLSPSEQLLPPTPSLTLFLSPWVNICIFICKFQWYRVAKTHRMPGRKWSEEASCCAS